MAEIAPYINPFVKALEDEKQKLVKLFSLSNDEYNDLAALSYAIMGNESYFGRSKKHWIKEHDQGDVILAKAAKRLVGKNPFNKYFSIRREAIRKSSSFPMERGERPILKMILILMFKS